MQVLEQNKIICKPLLTDSIILLYLFCICFPHKYIWLTAVLNYLNFTLSKSIVVWDISSKDHEADITYIERWADHVFCAGIL